jgi:uncharacterized alpha-E superfamily protein
VLYRPRVSSTGDNGDRDTPHNRYWLVGGGIAAAILTVFLVCTTAKPHLQHSNAINAVFDASYMVAGSRVLAIAVFGWGLASIGVRIERGQWIRTVGPVTADAQEGAEDLVVNQTALQKLLEGAESRIADLEIRLQESDRRSIDLLATIEKRRDNRISRAFSMRGK